MRKNKSGLTMLTRMIKVAVTPTAGRRKTRRLKKISRRRSAENVLGLPGVIRLESDNLMIFVGLIIRLHRLHPSLAVGPRDHIVGKKCKRIRSYGFPIR